VTWIAFAGSLPGLRVSGLEENSWFRYGLNLSLYVEINVSIIEWSQSQCSCVAQMVFDGGVGFQLRKRGSLRAG
jgi:hypothetical protein